jgi:antitoxin ParD1/3/4
MSTIEISLPESLHAFVEAQVESGAYESTSAYFERLVREAQEREDAESRLEALLLEGVNSGPGIVVTGDYWDKKKDALRARFEKRAA